MTILAMIFAATLSAGNAEFETTATKRASDIAVGRVTVKLDQGGKTLVEKNPKAKMGDFRGAMKEVGEKLGKEILNLK